MYKRFVNLKKVNFLCFLLIFQIHFIFGQLEMKTNYIGNNTINITLENKTTDTIYFPKDYYSIDLNFNSSKINRTQISTSKHVYPTIEYSDTNQFLKKCKSDINLLNIKQINPRKSFEFTYNLSSIIN